jgi:L-ascorbate metabolism protein UlaG (beta-lactamase superfamily)
MQITYYGHSCFKLKGKRGTVVTDPYDDSIGLVLPRLSADILTISHEHPDHSAIEKVGGTARRGQPFLINKPGEYEVDRISVFGVQAYHDSSQGTERGINRIYSILLDGIKVCHLGDLGHELTTEQLEAIGRVDILLCPVGGVYTIDPKLAVKAIRALEPGIVIPMHFKTDRHNQDTFGELSTLADFLREFGTDPQALPKLEVEAGRIPEETELMVLTEQVA